MIDRLRIINWNCAMAFRKKFQYLSEFNPDLIIVQECEAPEKLRKFEFEDVYWIGDNPNKGLGIFSLNTQIKFEEIEISLENNRWFVPLKILPEFSICAVWAGNYRKNKIIDKIPATYRTIQENLELFKGLDLLIGDFNNNVIWDKKSRKVNFRDTLDLIEECGYESIYHIKMKCTYGQEPHPTHIWRKNYDTPYHIDYSFLKKKHIDKLKQFTLFQDPAWIELSDHFPLLLDINL